VAGEPYNAGWFKVTRGEVWAEVVKANPLAYVLAALIAHRARWNDGFNRHGLALGEAFLGDFENYGMSERQYRTAKGQLQEWGFATFRATNKGTIGKLTDTRLFAIYAIAIDGQGASQKTDQPTNGTRASDGQVTDNRRLTKIGRAEEQKKGDTDGGPPGGLSKKERRKFEIRVICLENRLSQLKFAMPNDFDKGRAEQWKSELEQLKQKLGRV
jgi:hypothetical protein